jgi:hypothetical protein
VFSMLIAPQISRCLDLLKSFDSQSLIKLMVILAKWLHEPSPLLSQERRSRVHLFWGSSP